MMAAQARSFTMCVTPSLLPLLPASRKLLSSPPRGTRKGTPEPKFFLESSKPHSLRPSRTRSFAFAEAHAQLLCPSATLTRRSLHPPTQVVETRPLSLPPSNGVQRCNESFVPRALRQLLWHHDCSSCSTSELRMDASYRNYACFHHFMTSGLPFFKAPESDSKDFQAVSGSDRRLFNVTLELYSRSTPCHACLPTHTCHSHEPPHVSHVPQHCSHASHTLLLPPSYGQSARAALASLSD
jgi:hypothetical protein